MRNQFLLASAGVLALAGSAFAADLPSRAPPPVYLPPALIFTWTGVYVGGQIGYGWGTDGGNVSVPFAGGIAGGGYGGSPSGVIGGAHAGYNYQIQQWVLGLEGDVNGTSLSDTVVSPGGLAGLSSNTRTDIQGSIRGRLGVAWDRALIYATGGAAFGGFNTSYAYPVGGSSSFSNTRIGWTVGGGIEYAITNNWSVQVEYRYTDFGRFTDMPGGLGMVDQHHFTQNQVQAGFSYKFDMFNPTPVVAKY